MAKPVLFAGTRPYGRAENITALYDAYQGEKKYVEVHGNNVSPEMLSGEYDLLVIDDFPSVSPGTCIMIWHGIQGGKKIGFDQPNAYITPDRVKKVDYIISAGHGAVQMWSQCARFPRDRILPLGMARTDAYIGKRKGDGRTVLAGKKAYLYAPTFRWFPEPMPFEMDFDWLDEQLTDDEVLAVKAHMVGDTMLEKQYRHIIEIPQSEPSTPYLIDCDVVITDYSSIIFDGYLLGKPAVLYEPKEGYTYIRGMYMNYPYDYCSLHTKSEREMLNKIRWIAGKRLGYIEQKCVERVADMCDGYACERICKLIDDLNGGQNNG